MQLLELKVSYQANTWSGLSKELTIGEVLLDIKSEKYKQPISNLRDLLNHSEDTDAYDSQKRKLPAVTFCGTFNCERKKAAIKDYNSIIVLDIDKLDEDGLIYTKLHLQNDKYVFAFWESPSQKGLKGLVALQYGFELAKQNIDSAHKSAFNKLATYFKVKYNTTLDSSGSDTTRLCFLSYDPNLVLKGEFNPFLITEEDLSNERKQASKPEVSAKLTQGDVLYNPHGKNRPNDRLVIRSIIKFLEKKKESITRSYEEWYKVAMAIANTFTYEIGEKYFLKLSSFDNEKFNENNCKNFLRNCYEARTGAIRFQTIIFYAKQKGYLLKTQRDRGSAAGDESQSQVSSSNTVFHLLPEDLKK